MVFVFLEHASATPTLLVMTARLFSALTTVLEMVVADLMESAHAFPLAPEITAPFPNALTPAMETESALST